jgi:hypothetical protein
MVPDVKGKLSGEASKTLQQTIRKANKIERLVQILKFFNH